MADAQRRVGGAELAKRGADYACLAIDSVGFIRISFAQRMSGKWGQILRAFKLASALALAFAFNTTSAAADPLTRLSCWTWSEEDVSRTVCFVAPGRATMTNRSGTVNNKNQITSCNWSGRYTQSGTRVTVAFAAGSGRCSNDVPAPQYSLTCNFPGDYLDCKSSSLVNGQLLAFDRIFR